MTIIKEFAWQFCCLLTLFFCLCTVPALAVPIFSNLGSPGDVYNSNNGSVVAGSASSMGTSFTTANQFTAANGGNVTQINLAVSSIGTPAGFNASIWTNSGGLPGSQILGAFWGGLTSTTVFGSGFGLVTINGISGLSLNGGESYFMILSPENSGDSSFNAWNTNTTGVNGRNLASFDDGSSWVLQSNSSPIGAFDILSGTIPVPEPNTFTLLFAGFAVVGYFRSKKRVNFV